MASGEWSAAGGSLPPIANKEYFSMGEAAAIAHVPAHTLRYWESCFGTLHPSRLDGGHRRYNREDLSLILAIRHLVHERRMTIAGARKALFGRKRKAPEASAAEQGLPGGSSSAATARLVLEIKRELKNLVAEF